jgi:small subunit ribosomal protein S20
LNLIKSQKKDRITEVYFQEVNLPTTKTAEKEMRVAERRQARNKSMRSLTKTNVSVAEEMISAGNADAAKAKVKIAISTLDKEAGKGNIHNNNAARRKSRLMKKLNKIAAPAKPEASSRTEKK